MSKPTFNLIHTGLILLNFLCFFSIGFAQEPLRMNVHAPANTIKVFQDQAFICQGFKGLTLLNLRTFQSNPHQPVTSYYSEILALDVIAYSDNLTTGTTYLVSTRDQKLLWVAATTSPESPDIPTLSILREQPLEGTPIKISVQNSLLAVAGGGGGVGLYQLIPSQGTFRLSGRFPFAEFASDVLFLTDSTLAIIDTHNSDSMVLNIQDPQNPHRIQHIVLPQTGYLDHFSINPQKPTQLLMTSRSGAILQFQLNNEQPKPLTLIAQLQLPNNWVPDSYGNNVNSTLQYGDYIIILERYSGLHLATTTPELALLNRNYRLEDTRTAALWKDQLVISQENGILLLLPLKSLIPEMESGN